MAPIAACMRHQPMLRRSFVPSLRLVVQPPVQTLSPTSAPPALLPFVPLLAPLSYLAPCFSSFFLSWSSLTLILGNCLLSGDRAQENHALLQCPSDLELQPLPCLPRLRHHLQRFLCILSFLFFPSTTCSILFVGTISRLHSFLVFPS